MLQVVDEFDDALGTVRHQLEGVGQEIGPTIGGIAALGAVVLSVAAGAGALIIAGSLGALGTATLLKVRRFLPER